MLVGEYVKLRSECTEQVTVTHDAPEFDDVYHMSESSVKQAATTAKPLDPRFIEGLGHTMNEASPFLAFYFKKRKNTEFFEVSLDNIEFLVEFQAYGKFITIDRIKSVTLLMHAGKGRNIVV